MHKYSDKDIVDLMRSESNRDRNQACEILEFKFKTRVMAWTRKQKGDMDGEDVYQSAMLEFILAIQSGRYEPQEKANMYSYFYLIVRSVWIKNSQYHLKKSGDLEWYEMIPAEDRGQNPEEITDYELKRERFMAVIESLDLTERGIVNEIFVHDSRLVDIVDQFNLKNYNNAKQKLLSIRKKLSALFGNSQLFNDKND